MPLIDEIQLVNSQREGSANIDTYKNPQCEHMYFDGISQMSVNASVAKLDFFVSRGNVEIDGTDIQNREVTKVISLPTIELFSFIVNSFEGAINNREVLTEALRETFDKFDAVMARLKEGSAS